jgi:hypothetical protein
MNIILKDVFMWIDCFPQRKHIITAKNELKNKLKQILSNFWSGLFGRIEGHHC